jgi:hypothetical protein
MKISPTINPKPLLIQVTNSAKDEISHHVPHAAECYWIFQLRVQCTDVLELFTYDYSVDTALGITSCLYRRK